MIWNINILFEKRGGILKPTRLGLAWIAGTRGTRKITKKELKNIDICATW